MKLSTISSWTACCFTAISFNDVAASIWVFVLATTEAMLSFNFAMSSVSGAAAKASGVLSRTSFRTAANSVVSSKTFALPPTEPALATFVAMLLMTAADALSPEEAVTTEITLATFAAAFAIPADPLATKSVFRRSELVERPRPFATCAAAASGVTGSAPVALACETTASTSVVIGVITADPSGAFNSPVKFLPVETSTPPLTDTEPKPPCASINASVAWSVISSEYLPCAPAALLVESVGAAGASGSANVAKETVESAKYPSIARPADEMVS